MRRSYRLHSGGCKNITCIHKLQHYKELPIWYSINNLLCVGGWVWVEGGEYSVFSRTLSQGETSIHGRELGMYETGWVLGHAP